MRLPEIAALVREMGAQTRLLDAVIELHKRKPYAIPTADASLMVAAHQLFNPDDPRLGGGPEHLS